MPLVTCSSSESVEYFLKTMRRSRAKILWLLYDTIIHLLVKVMILSAQMPKSWFRNMIFSTIMPSFRASKVPEGCRPTNNRETLRLRLSPWSTTPRNTSQRPSSPWLSIIPTWSCAASNRESQLVVCVRKTMGNVWCVIRTWDLALSSVFVTSATTDRIRYVLRAVLKLL